MKCYFNLLTVVAGLWFCLSPVAFAQAPVQTQGLPSLTGASSAPAPSAPKVQPLGRFDPAAPPSAGTPPSGSTTQPTGTNSDGQTEGAGGSAVLFQKEAVKWNAQILQDELAESIRRSDIAMLKVKDPKAKLGATAIAALRSKISKNEMDIKSRMRLADHYEYVNDPEKQVELLRPLKHQLPRKGLLQLARAFRALKNHLDEIRVIQFLLTQNAADYVAISALGDAYGSLGKRDEAIHQFEEAKRINPRYLPPYEGLLRENKRAGFLTDAIQAAVDMMKIFGEKPSFYSELCLLYAHNAFLEKAIETCKQAIIKNPNDPLNHVFLALTLQDKEGPAASEKIINKAAQQFQKSELAQYTAGELAWERKNAPAAHKYFQQAIRIDPKALRSLLGLARSAFELQIYPESIEAFTRACLTNRVMVHEFRRSASILRLQNNFGWAKRFDDGLRKCGWL